MAMRIVMETGLAALTIATSLFAAFVALISRLKPKAPPACTMTGEPACANRLTLDPRIFEGPLQP
jgi:hypothetical protein